MKREKLAIGFLSITAALLLIACIVIDKPAHAQEVAVGRDYWAITFPEAVTGGGDGLYVANTRLGVMVVFIYDPTTRTLQARTARPLIEAFRPR